MLCAGTAAAQQGVGPRPAEAEQLFALANQSRAQAGAGPLQWDASLAAAAMKHCLRMTAEGEISHRYGGEPDVSERTAAAGAHFSLIEENIAVGSYAATIHDGWMHSPGHRTNLLNPAVDHVGIAVVASRGTLYAVADYSQAVAVLSPARVEATVAELLRMSGIAVRRDPHDARLACMVDRGIPPGARDGEPGFVMRWQGADLGHLPQALVDRLGSGQYRSAAVGSCPARNAEAAFTVYRVAVLLY
ncbi:MAG TPA: CAP domain-containing protein [Terracidiphilus sp.]|jgi:hypothetical protein|nr:CAP domain-containing protein [Terracidiphilus sp.]